MTEQKVKEKFQKLKAEIGNAEQNLENAINHLRDLKAELYLLNIEILTEIINELCP